MGCFMAVFALVSLLVGIALDQALGLDRRWATLICVLGGLPLNLFIAVRITRLLIARIIPPGTRRKASASGEEADAGHSGGVSA